MRAIFRDDVEARLVEEFFNDSRTGFFVDVGAADPTLGSQTWHLEQMGWNGVLIEPRPDCAQKLREARRAKVYQAACTSARNRGTARLHLRDGYSSLSDKLVIAGLTARDSIEVNTKTLDEILVDAGAPSPIDFISMDVEGHEVEVLDGLDLRRWRPRLIFVEDHVLDLRLHRALLARGYRWIRRTSLNGWYVPASDPTPVSWYGWLQFFRKYYLAMPTRWIRDTVRLIRTRLGIRPPVR
jgi:FkbM family methyltransferase